MTPEQQEQWRKAINPLDYLDFRALREAGLTECSRRMASLGVPLWARQLRESLVNWRFGIPYREGIESWHPQFALRSEVALIGLQILYPSPTEAESAYQRLFVRFTAHALAPFVKWARESPEQRLQGPVSYEPLVVLQTACASLTLPAMRQELDLRKYSFQRPSSLDQSEQEEGKEEFYCALSLGSNLMAEMRQILGIIDVDDIHAFSFQQMTTVNLIEYLNIQHNWRLLWRSESDMSEDRNYTHLIADAYLTALEAECPTPDWLIQRGG